ncbi:MGMT family protein [Vulcanisaeta sp. JCM 16161]|uniref:methylated-DNA--[protein]-cysteine S-methyltransferase n=1 Tax=Vulcanisaeta sp. JCM 16161 TaxID=1295372 RepID=UPI000A4F4CC0|nr:MGMT family protein [Vulcanisaeta sp. JCM 16161]
MLSIPRGRVATYAQLARLLNTSPRAIGKLASANRLPVIVPCHRVIKSDGSLGGYSAGDINVKLKLLELEGVKVINGKVPRHYVIDDATLMRNFRELLNYTSSNALI